VASVGRRSTYDAFTRNGICRWIIVTEGGLVPLAKNPYRTKGIQLAGQVPDLRRTMCIVVAYVVESFYGILLCFLWVCTHKLNCTVGRVKREKKSTVFMIMFTSGTINPSDYDARSGLI